MKLPGPACGLFVHNTPGKVRPRQTAGIVTLLTDFGLKDPYAGIMKGVIHNIIGAFTPNPYLPMRDQDVTVIDITHDVEPQNIREAAFLVEEYYRFFPSGTIHLAIVDPDVGSTRRPIILSKDNNFFVGPDNGIFTLIMDDEPVVNLIENPDFMLRSVSSTFHGRDIFAPAAAYLSKGVPVSAFGKSVSEPVRLQSMLASIEDNSLKGEVVRFDRFGNAITNIKDDFLKDFLHGRPFEVRIAGMTFTAVNKSYCEDTVTCLVGSSGYLEFGYYKGSFEEMAKIRKGEQVTIEHEPEILTKNKKIMKKV